MKKKIFIILFLLLLTGLLLYVNHDLFQYNRIFVFHRSFNEGIDTKSDYILSQEQIVLKQGVYQATIEGQFSDRGSGFFLLDSDEEKILTTDFMPGESMVQKKFVINESSKQVRFGVSWDPASKKIDIDRFIIDSDHVLDKSSFLKHAVISMTILIFGIILLIRIFFPNDYKKIFPHLAKPENERMILMILFLTILTSIPFFRSDTFVKGDDFYYHMRHLKGIAASLRVGHFPARILLDWLENYGYGSGFYYPNLFLTLPALLIICGFHEIAAYEIFAAICTFFALLTMFLTVRRISGSEIAAHASVILYAFAAYRLVDTYYRAALGEIQSFIFLPLIILGLYEIFNGHTERWWIFAAAFTGLLWCHVISLFLAVVFTAVWLLFSFKRIFAERKILFVLVKAVLLTVFLGMWFILPMAEQSMTNELKINTIMFSPETTPFGSTTSPYSLLMIFNDWNYKGVRKVYPGWCFLILPILRILFLRGKRNNLLKLADFFTLYGFFAMIMCTSLFPWKIFIQFLYRIQFSWRIMMISTVLLSVSCAVYASCLTDKYLSSYFWLVRLMPVFLLCLVSGGPILWEALTAHVLPMDYYRYIENSNFLSGSEYLPVNLKRDIIEKTKDNVLCDVPGFEMTSFQRKGLSVTWDYVIPDYTENAVMQVPLVYYTGYRGYFFDPDGTRHEILISKNDIGLITVANGNMSSGRIQVKYVKTVMQHIGDCVTLAALIYCCVQLLRRKNVIYGMIEQK